MNKKIIIIGSRRRDSVEDYHCVLREFKKWYDYGDVLVSGGCPKGGDLFAEVIANNLQIPIIIHYPKKPLPGLPKWDYAKVMYERNTVVVNEAEEDTVVIACVSPDRKGGTEDTIKKWRSRKFDGNLLRIV